MLARQLKRGFSASISFSGSPISEKRVQVQLKVLRRPEHRMKDALIPQSTWGVLDKLRKAGYEAYLVGGSVRDLLLNQIPKDFDVLSTAEPAEVKRSFPGRCFIVGKRFPICHVYSHGKTIEVSSFSTNLRCKGKNLGFRASKGGILDGTEAWDDRDFARWENSLKRDFTINGLIYDPFKSVLYDYVGGLRDLRKLKVRTVAPATESFAEDPARILRAIRIAARLGFGISRYTSRAIKDQRFSVLKLNKSRLMLEANMFFSYGAAEPSVRLLWRYGILELLLPLQAAYFVSQAFKRRDEGSNLLLDLLRNLDKVVAPDRPCHGSLWVALLAFHLAVSDRKTNRLVAAAAALSVYHTNDKRKAAEKAKRIHVKVEMQTLEAEGRVDHVNSTKVTSLLEEGVVEEEAALVLEDAKSLLNRMMDSADNAQATRALTGVENGYSAAVGQPYSHKVYGLFRRAVGYEFAANNVEGRNAEKEKEVKRILFDSQAVTRGDAHAVCYLFSRIVLNTLYPWSSNKA